MEQPGSFKQVSLVASIIATVAGSYMALSPPNPTTSNPPLTGDFLRHIGMTGKHSNTIVMAPIYLLSIHTSALAFYYPDIPSRLIGYGAENGLNPDLITWSASTSIPIVFTLLVGVPLRLVPYWSLGSDFTFGLRRPGRLNTTDIYRYVQHPSYTGLFSLMLSTIALFVRVDGVVSCWVPPFLYPAIRKLWFVAVPVVIAVACYSINRRVREEEQMLRDEFGRKWEEWHARTPRFLPWGF